jgi:hypothetical protein
LKNFGFARMDHFHRIGFEPIIVVCDHGFQPSPAMLYDTWDTHDLSFQFAGFDPCFHKGSSEKSQCLVFCSANFSLNAPFESLTEIFVEHFLSSYSLSYILFVTILSLFILHG